MATNVVPTSAAAKTAAPVHTPEPFTLVLFGATGDLAARKLLPAIHALWQRRFLPEAFAVVGVGRRDKSDDAFRADVRAALTEHGNEKLASGDDGRGFLEHCFYQAADLTAAASMQVLAERLRSLEAERKLPGNRLFYLAIDPDFFCQAIEVLAHTDLVRHGAAAPWSRVVIEKPFGHDLTSAIALDRHIHRFLSAEQIYRIDHYLGKETVQNLLAFRFGNTIFEPLFHRQHVAQVQITMAETVGMEGRRGAFYDHTGALRDVLQNHMLQLLALTAMEPPATLKAADISDAKLAVLHCLAPLRCEDVEHCVVRGQYGAGAIAGKPVRGYREEEAIEPQSSTETYVALRTEVESWRWAGVPFLLRTGKRMARRVTEIAVQFKLPPLRLFRTLECQGDVCDLTQAHASVLVFRIQPDEGISLSFSAKRPGMQLDLQPVELEFGYDHSFPQALPEAYERLLFDALRGDATLFMRSDELEAAWEFVTPILERWSAPAAPPLATYAAGSWGPAAAEKLSVDWQGSWLTR